MAALLHFNRSRIDHLALLVVVFTLHANARQPTPIKRYSTQPQEGVDGDAGVAKVTKLYPVPDAVFRSGRDFRNTSHAAVATTTDSSSSFTQLFPDRRTTTTSGHEDAEGSTTTDESSEEIPTTTMRSSPPATDDRHGRDFWVSTATETAAEAVSSASDRDRDVAATTTQTMHPELPEFNSVATTEPPQAASDPGRKLRDPPSTPRRPPPIKAPYPPAGFRPRRPFLLPLEWSSLAIEADLSSVDTHPVCGSNDDPIAPKPAPGVPDEPDAERVLITNVTGHDVGAAPRQPIVVALPLPLPPDARLAASPPLYAAPGRFN